MTHAHRGLLTAVFTCLLSSSVIAAAPAAPATPAAVPAAPGAKEGSAAGNAATSAAAATAPKATPERKRARGGGDARSCLKQADNARVRRCAEKYR